MTREEINSREITRVLEECEHTMSVEQIELIEELLSLIEERHILKEVAKRDTDYRTAKEGE